MSSSRPPLMATYLIISLILIILTATTHFTQSITPDDEQVSSASSQLHVIVEALIDSSNGDEILLVSTKPLNFPFPATYLIPLDNPSVMIRNTNSTTSSSSFTLDYHIIPQKLSFSKLQNLPIGSTIPTLIPKKSIQVTNNSQSNYTINHILITNPNFYMNGDVVIHGIKSCLNHSMGLLAKEDDICNRFIDDDDSKRSLTISREQQNVVGALLSSTQYHNWARALCEIPPSKFPRNATFLVSPSDPNISNHQSYSQKLTVWYHIIRKHLPFSVLQNLNVGSTIPTAYNYFGESRWWKSILVTNNSISNFTLDDVLITHPDLYVDAGVVVHGINSTINFKKSEDDEFVISIVENWGWNRWILLVFTIFFVILCSLRVAANRAVGV
ncbi:hypothetical protein MKX03_021823 [Papaver bracteatum]|nr:hypothetical protein MKX03_021823 [Papaver bracteatum]